MAKRYHPDAVSADASPEQREKASVNFARINAAYQLLKDGRGMWGGGGGDDRDGEYFATTLGGPMYDPRGTSRGGRRSSFYRGYDDEDYYGSSMFSGHAYSARYGPAHGRQQQQQQQRQQQHQPFRSQGGWHGDHNHGEARKNPFSRRYRQEVGDNCHVSGKEFPPFFNN